MIERKKRTSSSGWHEAPDASGKAPEHKAAQERVQRKNVMRQPMTSITPIREIKVLTFNTILEINRQIKELSIREPWIQYENKDDPILTMKLEKLVEYTPSLDIFEIAAYYLKNIILLQAFPDAILKMVDNKIYISCKIFESFMSTLGVYNDSNKVYY